ncbi:hypothetical protein SUGI_1072580 [Cryptomeria japonica]|nr:hypothetical protein SUGI_1072580 [Cryptomeria japonica]
MNELGWVDTLKYGRDVMNRNSNGTLKFNKRDAYVLWVFVGSDKDRWLSVRMWRRKTKLNDYEEGRLKAEDVLVKPMHKDVDCRGTKQTDGMLSVLFFLQFVRSKVGVFNVPKDGI